jgi:hypothetical protein
MDRKFLLQWVSFAMKKVIALPAVIMAICCADQAGANA